MGFKNKKSFEYKCCCTGKPGTRIKCKNIPFSGICTRDINNLPDTNQGDYALEFPGGNLYIYNDDKYVLVNPQPHDYYFYCQCSNCPDCGKIYFVPGNGCRPQKYCYIRKGDLLLNEADCKLYKFNGHKFCLKCDLKGTTGPTGLSGVTRAPLEPVAPVNPVNPAGNDNPINALPAVTVISISEL